jgi:Amt family ammonium transporter
MKFSALMWFVGLWSIAVYSPVAFWVWGGGFLSEAGILDFAGGTVVHINSGVAALVAAIMVGKRTGYGEENLAPHNLVLTMIGGSLLWVGWFGFNAGSAVGSNGLAGMAMLVTQIAAAAAALTWMLADWVYHRKPTVLGIVSGAVAGLFAITPASEFVGPVGAHRRHRRFRLLLGCCLVERRNWATTTRWTYSESMVLAASRARS